MFPDMGSSSDPSGWPLRLRLVALCGGRHTYHRAVPDATGGRRPDILTPQSIFLAKMLYAKLRVTRVAQARQPD
jgi:hypothetical protein